MRALALAVVVGCSAPAIAPVAEAPAPTVVAKPFPPPPAGRLPHTFEPTGYRLRLAVETEILRGDVAIAGVVGQATDVLWLHGVELAVLHANARRGSELRPLEVANRRDGFIGLRASKPLEPGVWTLELAYTARIDGTAAHKTIPHGAFSRLVAHETYVYTFFEPHGARSVVPCIDEPDRKVPWQLTLEVAATDKAFANAPAVRETVANDRRVVEFAPTRPLPPYLVAFAVGPFDVISAGKTPSGVPMQLVAPRGQGKDIAWAAPIAPQLLDRLERWFGIPYAYGKMDLVAVPHEVAAMEHPGLVTFDASLFTRDYWPQVATHEFAHQWFGNLVTPASWDDLWLAEGTATWLTRRLLGQELEVTSTLATARHFKDDETVEAFFEHLDYTQMYGVATSLERVAGEAAFRDGVRAYLTAHADRTATTGDLIDAVEHAAQPGFPFALHLAPAFDRILARGGPNVSLEIACRGAPSIDGVVEGGVGPAQPACIAHDRDGARTETCFEITDAPIHVPLAQKTCPRWWYPTRSLVRIQVPPEATRGWAFLTDLERRRAFGALEHAARLPVMTAMLTSSDDAGVALAATTLLEIYRMVPPKLRPALDAKVRALLGPRGKQIHLATASETDTIVARLLAFAGDTSFAADAQKLTLDDVATMHVMAIAADGDPTTQLFLLRRHHAYDISAASVARDFIDTVLADPAAFAALRPEERHVYALGVCDPARRPKLEQLAQVPMPDEKLYVKTRIDQCEQAVKAVEPAFTAWLKP